MDGKIFIFGLGYIGEAWAEMMAKEGYHITGTTRTPAKFAKREEQGWNILSYNSPSGCNRTQIASAIAQADIILSTIGLQENRDPVMADFKAELMAFKGWAGYLSVTSVYASQSEGWVDENTPANPQSKRGRGRLEAEQNWQALAHAEIFRLGGIYGPYRNPFDKIRTGTAQIIEKQGQLFNRMHQHDMCRVIKAATTKPRHKRVINLVDGAPAAQGDMIRFSASLLGIAPPAPIPFEQAQLSEMGRSFYQTSRRIRSVITGPELGVELIYPDYKSGLTASLEAEQHSQKQR